MGAGASFAGEDSDFDDADALFGGHDVGGSLGGRRLHGDEAERESATLGALGGLVMMRSTMGSDQDGFPSDQYTQHVRDLGGGHIRIIHRSVHRIGDRDGSMSRGPRFLSGAVSSRGSHETSSHSSALGSRRTSAGGTAILPRYACHQCHRTFILHENTGLFCPYCNCDFVEEVEHSALAAIRGHGNLGSGGPFSDSSSSATVSSLTPDQQVRLISAAAFLQMLEIHLRDEILSLRTALDAGGGSVSAKSGPRKLTARERHAALRSLLLDTDSLCGQPSCPICSEDFKEGITVTQIQCSHFFHDACVLPWLEMKRSCPICRFEISAAAPEPETLGALTESELRSRIRWLGCPSDLKDSSKPDLALLLCRELTQHLDKFEGADDDDDEEEAEAEQSDSQLNHHHSRGERYNSLANSGSISAPIIASSVLGALSASAADARLDQPQPSRVIMRPGYTYTISSSGAISTHSAPRPTGSSSAPPAGASADID